MSLAGLILGALLVCQQSDPVAEAGVHLDAGRYAQAVELLKPLAEKNPESVTIRFNLALAQSLAGNDGEAIAGFRKALELKPELYEARLNLAQLLVKTGQFGEASTLLDACLQTKPEDPKAIYLSGRAAVGQGDLAKAAAALEKSVTLTPKDEGLGLELADLYEKAKQPAKAAEVYGRYPHNAAAQERRGVLLISTGDYPAAIEALELARKTSPTPAILFALATAHLRSKHPEAAIPLAAQLVEAGPGDFDMRLFYGRLLRDQKRYEEALPQFLAAVKIKPDAGDAWNELTAILLLTKRYEQGLMTLDKARELNGETSAYYYFRATMLDALKQHKPALESYEKFLSMSQGKFPDEEFKARERAKALAKAVRR
ncbi:MAG: tetratricopeptide repeat protein [Acidobacteria bacterium]|nr:tetratricopeptide repeat protein [Acidobacteriota bacterium]